MKSILITGCNRGLGLGLVKQLLKENKPTRHIIATCRNIDTAKELTQIADANDGVHVLQLDVQKTESFESFTNEVERIVGDDGLNVLFNNAGYSPKSTRINFVKTEQLMDTFAINTVGPVMLTKALMPLLKKAAAVNKDQPLSIKRAAILNMSSYLGSIAMNKEGGLYPYRCSKVALNMVTKSLSLDLKADGIMVTSVHPGWVKTDLGGSNAPLTVEKSVNGIVKLMYELNDKHNGAFYDFTGKELPW